MRGTLGGSEHRNTAKKFGKYRNTAKKFGKYRNTAKKIRKKPQYRKKKSPNTSILQYRVETRFHDTETTTLHVKG